MAPKADGPWRTAGSAGKARCDGAENGPPAPVRAMVRAPRQGGGRGRAVGRGGAGQAAKTDGLGRGPGNTLTAYRHTAAWVCVCWVSVVSVSVSQKTFRGPKTAQNLWDPPKKKNTNSCVQNLFKTTNLAGGEAFTDIHRACKPPELSSIVHFSSLRFFVVFSGVYGVA